MAMSVPKGKKRIHQGKVKETVGKSNGGTYTKNIFYKEVLHNTIEVTEHTIL
jgi:hypothetical protein